MPALAELSRSAFANVPSKDVPQNVNGTNRATSDISPKYAHELAVRGFPQPTKVIDVGPSISRRDTASVQAGEQAGPYLNGANRGADILVTLPSNGDGNGHRKNGAGVVLDNLVPFVAADVSMNGNGHHTNGTGKEHTDQNKEHAVAEVSGKVQTMAATVDRVLAQHPDWSVPLASKFPGARMARILEGDDTTWEITTLDAESFEVNQIVVKKISKKQVWGSTHGKESELEVIEEVSLVVPDTTSDGDVKASFSHGKASSLITDGRRSTRQLPGDISHAEALIEELGQLSGIEQGGTVTEVENLGSGRDREVYPEKKKQKLQRMG
ncbi:MAG: hypothetical protein ACR2LN_01540 [Candidatus Levyibacteriota bacterium]